ncbi:MAG: glycosyltransferase family 9 protein, partial [Armatimonadota bacterium]|nr:glycosyltransferase family 9 protein [Armatimonadota bacterium]
SLTLNRSFHSALTPWLAGSPVRAGSRAEGRSFLFTHRLDYDTDKSEIECYLDVLRAVEPDVPTDPSLELWLTDAECLQAAQRLRVAFDVDLDRIRLLGLQPGASNLSKQWDSARFAQTADALLAAHPNVRLFLLGGAEERATADAMLALMEPENRRRAANFVGELDLRASLAMVSQADVFLGNDTALRHSAVALHIPSIALFGPTNPRKWGNYGSPHRNLVSDDGTMAGIEVADVIGAVDALLTSSAGVCAV